ncbi:MAG: ABC transporter permease subunit [Anaerolineales bacterium]|nr:ABC transporter permease subunit [Anaerolineales bacterium]
MNDKAIHSNENQIVGNRQGKSSNRKLPAWKIVFKRELTELWIWGKGIYLMLFYSIFLGVSSFVFASNNELSLMPPREMMYLTLSNAITVSLFIALIIGADSFSGERERSTLEALLLTPANRRQIVLGKFLASISLWPLAYLITIPFVVLLSQGNNILVTALLTGAFLGTLLSLAFTGFGMLVSIWSNSNRTSLFVSLTVYLLFLLPVQFPGGAQTGTMGRLLKQLDPLEGADHFLEKIIVNNRTVGEVLPFLWASVIFAVLIFVLLFLFAAPRLNLDGGIPVKIRKNKSRLIVTTLLAIGLIVSMGISPAQALQDSQAPLQITVDIQSKAINTGEKLDFNTTVINSDTTASAPLIVAMNIINLDANGDVVDPEDWSPQRTQYIVPLDAGQSASQTWTINPILGGNYMMYMVVIPEPSDQGSTSQPVASSGIHLTVQAVTRLNPGGVLPLAIGIPILLMLGLVLLLWFRRRGIDSGNS